MRIREEVAEEMAQQLVEVSTVAKVGITIFNGLQPLG